jgi:hypothetical protein
VTVGTLASGTLEITGLVLGAVLTFMILSYVFGDNPLYRLALHLFIGALVGYVFGVVLRDVVIGMALGQLQSNRILVVPLAMGLWLLLFKGIPRLAYAGNFVTAYLVGVGMAVALSGALLGTLVPQVRATGRALSVASVATSPAELLDGVMIFVGTICTLMAFNFAAPKERGLAGTWARVVDVLAWVGRVLLIFAFAAAFAGALTASLSVFIGRVQYLIEAFTEIYFYVTGS